MGQSVHDEYITDTKFIEALWHLNCYPFESSTDPIKNKWGSDLSDLLNKLRARTDLCRFSCEYDFCGNLACFLKVWLVPCFFTKYRNIALASLTFGGELRVDSSNK